jgi:hypothetical protein
MHHTKFIGAGVLPYAYKNDGSLVFLLGMDTRGSDKTRSFKYSDFGGRREKDETHRMTAYREFIEETLDVYGKHNDIKHMINHPSILYKSKNTYYEFVIRIKYDKNMSDIFNRILNQIKKCMRYKDNKIFLPTCPTGYIEKIKLKWFTPQEILKNKDNFRPVFYETFKDIFKRLKQKKLNIYNVL